MANLQTYGFINLESQAADRVTTVGERTIWEAIRESAAEYSRGVNALLASFARRTTDFQIQFNLPGVGTLQPLDEHGNPLPVRELGHYTVGFPIQGAGTAWGTNRITRARMTVEEADRQTLEAMKKDSDWMRRHLLAAIFDNVAWTFDDPDHGNLTIEPLANSDTVTYVRIGGTSAIDEHYLAQAGAIADATNPFPTMYAELMEHPSNTGPIVAYIPTANVAAVQGLTNFIPVGDPDVILGAATDRLAGVIDRGLGDEVLGKVDNVWCIEWRVLPDDYLIAHAQGAGPFAAMREYDAPELQGFFPETHSSDGNLQELRMLRYCGFGIENRIAALVQRVGNGAYAIPAAYAAPLAA